MKAKSGTGRAPNTVGMVTRTIPTGTPVCTTTRCSCRGSLSAFKQPLLREQISKAGVTERREKNVLILRWSPGLTETTASTFLKNKRAKTHGDGVSNPDRF